MDREEFQKKYDNSTLQTIFLLLTRYTFVTMVIGISKRKSSDMNNRKGTDPMA